MSALPDLDISVREKPIVLRVRTICISIPIPDSLFSEFTANAQREKDERYSLFTGVIPFDVRASVLVTANSSTPFNRPSNGVASKKTRLKRILRGQATESHVIVRIEMHEEQWQKVEAKATECGIPPLHVCLLGLDYHIQIGLKRMAMAEPASPLDRFEKKLHKEHRKGRVGTAATDRKVVHA